MEAKINKSASADKMVAKAKEFFRQDAQKIVALSEECAKELIEKDITAKKQAEYIENYFDQNLRIGKKEVGKPDINKSRFKRFYERVYREIDKIFHPEDYPNEQ
jgi:hypothetical protein